MPREYKTIEEVSGPLVLVRGVSNVNYDDLGEIELEDGTKKRCKVLEIDGTNALVQLFESSAGINLSNSKVKFLGRSMQLPLPEKIGSFCPRTNVFNPSIADIPVCINSLG